MEALNLSLAFRVVCDSGVFLCSILSLLLQYILELSVLLYVG